MEYTKEELQELRAGLLHKPLVVMTKEELLQVKVIIDASIKAIQERKANEVFEAENNEVINMVNNHSKRR